MTLQIAFGLGTLIGMIILVGVGFVAYTKAMTGMVQERAWGWLLGFIGLGIFAVCYIGWAVTK